jgi:hypothetical protein
VVKSGFAGKVSLGQLNRSAVLPSRDHGDIDKPRRNRLPDAIRLSTAPFRKRCNWQSFGRYHCSEPFWFSACAPTIASPRHAILFVTAKDPGCPVLAPKATVLTTATDSEAAGATKGTAKTGAARATEGLQALLRFSLPTIE